MSHVLLTTIFHNDHIAGFSIALQWLTLMPGFHPSVAVLPFRCAVLPFRCTVAELAVVPFRSYRCRCRENGIDGNVFPLMPLTAFEQ